MSCRTKPKVQSESNDLAKLLVNKPGDLGDHLQAFIDGNIHAIAQTWPMC